MLELMFMYVFLPGLFAFLTGTLIIGTVLYYVARIIGAVWSETPLAQRWEREAKERNARINAQHEARYSAIVAECAKQERVDARNAERVSKGLAVEFNGEVCTVKRVGGKDWIKVRGQWMPYA